jgi:tetratricopeptide (TPR) repeat protein
MIDSEAQFMVIMVGRDMARFVRNPSARKQTGSNPQGARGEDVSPPTLEETKALYKQAAFGPRLYAGIETLHERLRGTIDLRDTGSLKALCLVAEVFDYLGDSRAREVVRQAPVLLGEVPRVRSSKALELRREQVRYLADFARIAYYREARYLEARQLLQACRDEALRLAEANPEFQCLGTRAQISYYLGCAHRQLREYSEAETCYGEAIQSYRLKAEVVATSGILSFERIDRERRFARYRSALCLGLGFGWVNYTRGLLASALNENIGPAQVLLLDTSDRTNQAYLSLLRGAILRCQAGSDGPRMQKAIEAVEAAQKAFAAEKLVGRSYDARAAYERALCALSISDLPTAESNIGTTEKIAVEQGDLAWQANALIVRSRIFRRRGDLKEADSTSRKAQILAASVQDPLKRIDASIERGEVLIAGRAFERARAELNAALSETSRGERPGATVENPKLEGILHIHLARTYIGEGQRDAATRHFHRWLPLAGQVEHAWVRELAADTKEQLLQLNPDFTVPAASEQLTYAARVSELRRWLIAQARQKMSSKVAIAKALGVSRQTLDAWENDRDLEGSRSPTSNQAMHGRLGGPTKVPAAGAPPGSMRRLGKRRRGKREGRAV